MPFDIPTHLDFEVEFTPTRMHDKKLRTPITGGLLHVMVHGHCSTLPFLT